LSENLFAWAKYAENSFTRKLLMHHSLTIQHHFQLPYFKFKYNFNSKYNYFKSTQLLFYCLTIFKSSFNHKNFIFNTSQYKFNFQIFWKQTPKIRKSYFYHYHQEKLISYSIQNKLVYLTSQINIIKIMQPSISINLPYQSNLIFIF